MPNLLLEKLNELNDEQLAQIYKNVFNTPEGQLLLEDLKNRSFFYTTTAHENSHRTYWQEGMRSVVLHIQSQLTFEKTEIKNDAVET